MALLPRPFIMLMLVITMLSVVPALAMNMTISSFTGPVTEEELGSFNSFISTLTPAANNSDNTWVQGDSGEQTKAMGLMYLMAGQDKTIENMVRFCDAVLSERNDIAPPPLGQRVIWTGDIAPVWPNNFVAPIYTGGEQGDPVGHLASCAYLILRNGELHQRLVPFGDPHGHGATYLERAKTFVREGDVTMEKHILPRLLNLTDGNKMYFANDSPYKGGLPVPWNQQMMFNYAFQNLVAAHLILQDQTTLVKTYRDIMTANLAWFFTGGGANRSTTADGSPIYVWDYAYDDRIEDSNHASLDIAGFARAYIDGRWGITPEMMLPLANTFVDVMTYGNGTYAGTVDGQCGTGHLECTDYVRSGFMFLAQWRPDAYLSMMSADFTVGGNTTSTDEFSRFLWEKNLRARERGWHWWQTPEEHGN